MYKKFFEYDNGEGFLNLDKMAAFKCERLEETGELVYVAVPKGSGNEVWTSMETWDAIRAQMAEMPGGDDSPRWVLIRSDGYQLLVDLNAIVSTSYEYQDYVTMDTRSGCALDFGSEIDIEVLDEENYTSKRLRDQWGVGTEIIITKDDFDNLIQVLEPLVIKES